MNAAAIALNRFGLGARPGDPLPRDPRAWLEAQLGSFDPRPPALGGLPDRFELGSHIAESLQQVRASVRRSNAQGAPADAGAEMAGAVSAMADEADMAAGSPQALRTDLQRSVRRNYRENIAARLASALTAQAPFVERLVHFWANHFAISIGNVAVTGMAGSLEFDAIRPTVLGNFADMLLAVEQHPAMLLYLDQAQSLGPNSRQGLRAARRGRQRGLNENLAREILELHTLGVGGGYGQADVTELARALTGWTVGGFGLGAGPLLDREVRPGAFVFADVAHEPGERTILGRRYAAAGAGQGRAILADLAVHRSTARHLATKLARHFAGDEPPPAMIRRLESAYLESGGDLPAVYRAIVASPEGWAPQPAKFKTPWEWTVSALRAVSAETLPPAAAAATLEQLGQPTWRPGSPAGWDDIAASWAGPDALVRRAEVAQRIAARAGGPLDPRALAEQVLPGALGDATRTAIAGAESPQQGLALLLVSPEFLRR